MKQGVIDHFRYLAECSGSVHKDILHGACRLPKESNGIVQTLTGLCQIKMHDELK
jgi:hypothetical protein